MMKVEKIVVLLALGMGAKIVGKMLYNSAGRDYYNSIGKTVPSRYANMVQAKAVTGKVLQTTGNIMIGGAFIKQYKDYKKYW